ncbi:hypothetical protein F8388_017571 [Cannabis sativa]|uniref:Uncharacterized protein n=1 Tax=Cannabis sativa TaxID=3483 RepID=A0A7J6DV83_CANSA|nr:hypothetical protein F8388_017571 [Cannabis sativa]
MDKERTLIYVLYDGRWVIDEKSKSRSYVDHQVKIIIMTKRSPYYPYNGIYDWFIHKICEELGLDSKTMKHSIKMSFDPKLGSNNKEWDEKSQRLKLNYICSEIMDKDKKTLIYILYDGMWIIDENSKSRRYVDHQVKIIMQEDRFMGYPSYDGPYDWLIDKICKELRLDSKTIKNSIKISFDPKFGSNNKGMKIENHDNVSVFLYLIKNDPEFKKCPIVVEFETN